jgi:acyl-coenzyme A synthetase/AMP-(fatty) acid ligase
VGGVNVSPAEVEAVLREVAGVAEVGVCGLPDADLGEIVAAAVVLAPGARPEEVTRAIDRAAAELSGLKRPKRLAFVSALPRSPLGKLMRARLRAEAFGE